MVYEFKGFIPVVHESSFIHPQATVIGNVHIGKNVYVGPSAVVRGDWGGIIIHDGCNIQENCTVHMFPGITIHLHENAHIGHGAIIHGATIGKNVLIGMNSVIMDNAQVGDESIVGAMTFIKANAMIPNRSLVVGNPYKITRQVSDQMLDWKTKGTKLYQTLPQDCQDTLRAVEPLRAVPDNQPTQESLYKTWNEINEE